MNKKILLVGGGGHCKSVLDALLQTGHYSEIGIIDMDENIGKTVLSVPVIGNDNDLQRFFQYGYSHAFVTLGSIGNPGKRVKLFHHLEMIGFEIPIIMDNTALIGQDVKLDKGVFIGKNAVVNVGSIIHKGAIINTSAVVEHDCVIDEFVHIAPGTVLCGEVHIGTNSHIGAGSVVKQQVRVGANVMIGMGSVVTDEIADNVTAFGNPCREVRR
ncbi:acetyltransferase [Cohnella panacarvi]|uniref:acetyltransferase n=1 Tax=Cohnella panacarvi TaxID=400776 RepID=UPI00047C9A53|nr:acetyltransferase [Cohnella panacarvi]